MTWRRAPLPGQRATAAARRRPSGSSSTKCSRRSVLPGQGGEALVVAAKLSVVVPFGLPVQLASPALVVAQPREEQSNAKQQRRDVARDPGDRTTKLLVREQCRVVGLADRMPVVRS